MDISKLLTGICVFLLLICIVFCTTALVSLRNAVEESKELQSEAQDLIFEMNGCLDQLEKPLKELATDRQDTSVDATVPQDAYCLRQSDGILCIYTADGELVQCLDVDVQTLPQHDREMLNAGISCATWQELMTLVQDYTQ